MIATKTCSYCGYKYVDWNRPDVSFGNIGKCCPVCYLRRATGIIDGGHGIFERSFKDKTATQKDAGIAYLIDLIMVHD